MKRTHVEIELRNCHTHIYASKTLILVYNLTNICLLSYWTTNNDLIAIKSKINPNLANYFKEKFKKNLQGHNIRRQRCEETFDKTKICNQ